MLFFHRIPTWRQYTYVYCKRCGIRISRNHSYNFCTKKWLWTPLAQETLSVDTAIWGSLHWRTILAFSVQDSHVEYRLYVLRTNDLEYVYLPNTFTTKLHKSNCGHRWHRRPSAVTQPSGGVFTGGHLRNLSLRFPYRFQTWSTDHM